MNRVLFLFVALIAASVARADVTADDLTALQHAWARANYVVSEKEREAAFEPVATQAEMAVARSPGRAEPLVWQAIVLSSYAKAQGGLGALDKIKRARDLLLKAEKMDPQVLDGSVYTSLGSLYAKAPGWPLSFGDKKKAKAYLEQALSINPAGIDPNYFYGELLADGDDTAGARLHLQRALSAPPRPGREDADQGRRAEVQAALDRLPHS